MNGMGDPRTPQVEGNHTSELAASDGLPTQEELATLQRVPATIPWRGK